MKASPGITDLMLTIQAVSRLDAANNKLVLTIPATTKLVAVMFRDPGQFKVAYLVIDANDKCMMTLRENEHGSGKNTTRIEVTDPVDVAKQIVDHFN